MHQRAEQPRHARTPRRLDQGPVDHVALRMTSAESVRHAANRPQQLDGLLVPALREGLDGARCGLTDVERVTCVVVIALRGLVLGVEQCFSAS